MPCLPKVGSCSRMTQRNTRQSVARGVERCVGCGALRVGDADAAAGRDKRSAAAKARQKRLEQQLAGDGAGSRHNVRYRPSRRLTMGDEASQHFERVLLEQRRLGL
jgi:hypothetical protein